MRFQHPGRLSSLFAFLILLGCANSPVFAKGGGVGYWLEGTISSVDLVDNRVELVLSGLLILDQYTGGPSTRQSVQYECKRGMRASLVQWQQMFFIMSTDWRGGALRGDG